MIYIRYTSVALARRLESAEAAAKVVSIEACAKVEPQVGATYTKVAGVHAMYDGPQSPLTLKRLTS